MTHKKQNTHSQTGDAPNNNSIGGLREGTVPGGIRRPRQGGLCKAGAYYVSSTACGVAHHPLASPAPQLPTFAGTQVKHVHQFPTVPEGAVYGGRNKREREIGLLPSITVIKHATRFELEHFHRHASITVTLPPPPRSLPCDRCRRLCLVVYYLGHNTASSLSCLEGNKYREIHTYVAR